ncbi:MAG: hypothetical protein KO463_06005 [Candidatus Methanofastidiosa archaeon]|nr:hypothetical protein [Candidatus Methanofastidiosa archaeon]
MYQSTEKMTVSSVINDALSMTSKYPLIILLFLVPGLLSLLGGAAIGGSMAWGNIDTTSFEEGSFEIGTFMPAIGAAAALSILVSIVSILVSGIAISMAADAWEGRPVSLGAAFDFMKDKWLLLIVAAIILAVLQFIGILACCIGYVVVVVATVFVRQGIVLDDMPLTEAFGNSFDLAKKYWPDILVLFIINFIAMVILALIPFIGAFVTELVGGFFTVAFTIYYIGLTKAPPSY